MKIFLVLIAGLFFVTAGFCEEAERNANQAELDDKCEAARQKALGPARQEIFKECMEKKNDELVCKIEADQYNGARADRGPLFYDLPECETAFNNNKGI